MVKKHVVTTRSKVICPRSEENQNSQARTRPAQHCANVYSNGQYWFNAGTCPIVLQDPLLLKKGFI